MLMSKNVNNDVSKDSPIEMGGYPKVAQVAFYGIFQKTEQNYVGCQNLL